MCWTGMIRSQVIHSYYCFVLHILQICFLCISVIITGLEKAGIEAALNLIRNDLVILSKHESKNLVDALSKLKISATTNDDDDTEHPMYELSDISENFFELQKMVYSPSDDSMKIPTDFCLIAETRQIFAQKGIMFLSCPFIQQLCQKQTGAKTMIAKKLADIYLKNNVKYDVALHFLRLIYYGTAQLAEEDSRIMDELLVDFDVSSLHIVDKQVTQKNDEPIVIDQSKLKRTFNEDKVFQYKSFEITSEVQMLEEGFVKIDLSKIIIPQRCQN